MSEENTRRTRQIFYALRFAELISQASSMLNVLDADVLDEDAIDNSKSHVQALEISADSILRSTRKLLD
jgi:hypothetical protein